ncbi:MAG: winged helix-turn-helix domain-containing protein [Acidobacteria bacterium]|nr:winged helix-turn-helix domain-containing protein [Acidobacteriota bacterium]
MGTQRERTPRITFGPFEYEVVSGDLRKYGNRVRLQGKPLQILSLLIERPGQVISREELQRHLWRSASFGDFEQGLNAAVNRLRQALGDSADQPRYIETVPGRGYRFIAPIDRASPPPVLEIAAPSPIRTDRRAAAKARIWLPGAVALSLVAVGAVGYWLGTRRTQPPSALHSTRFVIDAPPGFALEGAASRQSFALSPDGARLAFTAMDASGAFRVFLRNLNSLDVREVPDSRGAHTVFWPPDGRSLFLTVRGKVRRARLDGSVPVIVSESPSFMPSGAWLGPDKLLLGSYRTSFTVAASGGTPERLKQVYPWPQVLPGGEHVLYMRWDSQTRRHRAVVARFHEPASAKELIESDSRVLYTASALHPGSGYLVYVRAGTLMAHPFDPHSLRLTGEAIQVAGKIYSFFPSGAADFSVSDQGVLAYQSFVSRSQLVSVDRHGRQLSTIGPAHINVKSARISPDGRKLVTAIYEVEQGAQDLWLFDTGTGAGRRLCDTAALRDGAVWSPDSRSVAYISPASPFFPRVVIRGLGERDPEQAFAPGGFQLTTDWSPDGRFIVFVNTGFPLYANETQGDVWVADLHDGRKQIPLLDTKFHEANAVFSPDSKWLAFTSNESGSTELYVQRFQAAPSPIMVGERYLVSRAGAAAVRWRRDARELFYLGADGRVYAVPVRLSPRPEFGEPKPLFTISTEARAAIHSIIGFDVSPDGQRFVIPVVTSPERPSLVVIQNWEAALSSRSL